VAVSDIDGDGNLDLVVANLGSDTVGVLLGNGDGTFQSQTTFASGADPHSVAIADINGDGRPDLAVANFSSNTIGVLLGNGDGTFQAQVTHATGLNPQTVQLADVNGDGTHDGRQLRQQQRRRDAGRRQWLVSEPGHVSHRLEAAPWRLGTSTAITCPIWSWPFGTITPASCWETATGRFKINRPSRPAQIRNR
jgi:hypothetical protein